MDGIKALFSSEKALAGGMLVIAATVLVALGHMTTVEWQSYTQVIFVGYIGGKTVQGVASVWADTKKVEAVNKPTEVKIETNVQTKTEESRS